MPAMPPTSPTAPATFEVMLDFFKALANENRLRIVALLLARPHHVKELAAELQLKEPTVCHHLALLSHIGLVDLTVKGNAHYYAVRDAQLRRLGRSIFSQRKVIAHATPDENARDARVLKNYLTGEALKTLPATRKKRWVILKWLAEKFALGKRYREAEVNDVLQRHYWDSATLRRELIGYRMLKRQKGVYWREPESEWLRVPERLMDA